MQGVRGKRRLARRLYFHYTRAEYHPRVGAEDDRLVNDRLQ